MPSSSTLWDASRPSKAGITSLFGQQRPSHGQSKSSLFGHPKPEQQPSQRERGGWENSKLGVWRLSQKAARSSSSSSSSRNSARHMPIHMHMHMHMGHSHGHHHHDHEHSSSEGGGGAMGGRMMSGGGSSLSNAENTSKKQRRRVALFVFASLAILGQPLIRRRRIGRTDMATFVLTSLTLFTFDKVRLEVVHAIRKIRGFRDGIVKHSAPVVDSFTPRTVYNYLFRNDNAADRVTLLGGAINTVLSCTKFLVGVSCHSSALIADAGHSLSDLVSDFITLWAVQIGRLPPDDDHPYGHAKFEAIGSLFLALTLLGTGLSVGAVSNRRLIEILALQTRAAPSAAASLSAQVPAPPALLMAAASIGSKEWLYRITRGVGERLNSQVVIANAWHHRSDAYSSILALIAIGLAMFFPALVAADAAAGILVAGMICMTGADILGESIKQLTDTSNEALVERVQAIVKDSADVHDVKRIRARQVGSSAMVDVDIIATADDLSTSASRHMEERLRLKIMEETGVVDAEVHATAKDVVICPLLLAQQQHEAAEQWQQQGGNGEDLSPDSLSHTQIEDGVRRQIMAKPNRHPAVKDVHGVTVRYDNSILAHVDVIIDMTPHVTTVAAAGKVADELRQSLESLETIHKANIFLNLNHADDPDGVAAVNGNKDNQSNTSTSKKSP